MRMKLRDQMTFAIEAVLSGRRDLVTFVKVPIMVSKFLVIASNIQNIFGKEGNLWE